MATTRPFTANSITANSGSFRDVTANTVTTNTAQVNVLTVTSHSSNTIAANTLTVSQTADINTANVRILTVTGNTSANVVNATRIVATNVNANGINSNSANIVTVTANTANIANAKVQVLEVQDLAVSGNSSLAYERGTQLRSYREYVASANAVSGVQNLDLLDSNVFQLGINANTTLGLTNVPAAGNAVSVTVIVKYLTANARITFPANTVWSDGIAPVQSTGVNQTDIFTLMTFNGGAMIVGSHSFANVS